MEVEDFILGAMTERLESAELEARKARVAEWNAANDILKRGIAVTPVKFGISFTLTHLNQAGALVHVYQDGSIHMNHGGTEMGQGLFQKVAQVAADRFGVGMDRVKITATDTGKVPNTSATAASSGSDLNGMAVKAACDEIRGRIAEVVAPELQATAQVVFEGGMVRAGGAAMPFEEAVQKTYMARVSLSATGFYKTPKIEWDRIAGTRAAVLLLRLWRGLFRGRDRHADRREPHPADRYPARLRAVAEPGARYRPDRGRLRAGRGLADDGGAGLGRPRRAQDPCAVDLQDPGLFRPTRRVFNVALWDGENREDTIYRSKAVGEPPLMLGISVHSALAQACAACGPNFPDLQAPATPEAILAAVGRARGDDRDPVTVVSTRGSAPREAGAAMLVTADGIEGTIGGGALEWEAMAQARAMLGAGHRSNGPCHSAPASGSAAAGR
jgi:xanthine dehydrogenase large subunit